MSCLNVSDITIITVKNVDYNLELINLLKNYVLENRGYIYKNLVINFSLFKAFFYLFLFNIYIYIYIYIYTYIYIKWFIVWTAIRL